VELGIFLCGLCEKPTFRVLTFILAEIAEKRRERAKARKKKPGVGKHRAKRRIV
jgi:hypothetical protein